MPKKRGCGQRDPQWQIERCLKCELDECADCIANRTPYEKLVKEQKMDQMKETIKSLRICAGEGETEGCEGCMFEGLECFNGKKLLLNAADILEKDYEHFRRKEKNDHV